MTATNRLMLSKEIIAVYSENHMNVVNTLWANYSLLKHVVHIFTTSLQRVDSL
jgi:hypothetical protein